mmetsp:Transcript_81683/g.216738  ORF Transcript_81683/g.216738 Transcript_81683/m.216738 type:complete len:238 (+) Transcript_81683:105-818(+)
MLSHPAGAWSSWALPFQNWSGSRMKYSRLPTLATPTSTSGYAVCSDLRKAYSAFWHVPTSPRCMAWKSGGHRVKTKRRLWPARTARTWLSAHLWNHMQPNCTCPRTVPPPLASAAASKNLWCSWHVGESRFPPACHSSIASGVDSAVAYSERKTQSSLEAATQTSGFFWRLFRISMIIHCMNSLPGKELTATGPRDTVWPYSSFALVSARQGRSSPVVYWFRPWSRKSMSVKELLAR